MVILAAEKDCVYCDKNWEWWARVQTRVGNVADLEIVDVHASLTPAEARARGADPTQFLKMQFDEIQRMQFTETPTTLVLNDRGTVVRSWVGVFDASRLHELEDVVNTLKKGDK
jgi:hypothetical protein